MSNRSTGFTLIELVVVVVILGVLAVTALPRFINLQSNAYESTLLAMKGALEGAALLSYSKAATQGTERIINAPLDIEGGTITTIYGYVSSQRDDIALILNQDFDAAFAEWRVEGTGGFTPGGDPIRIRHARIVSSAVCFVEYVNATSVAPPRITVSAAGC